MLSIFCLLFLGFNNIFVGFLIFLLHLYFFINDNNFLLSFFFVKQVWIIWHFCLFSILMFWSICQYLLIRTLRLFWVNLDGPCFDNIYFEINNILCSLPCSVKFPCIEIYDRLSKNLHYKLPYCQPHLRILCHIVLYHLSTWRERIYLGTSES